MSLSPQTIRIRHQLRQRTQGGREHWDLYRWMLDPILLTDATRLVIRNAGAPGLDEQRCEDIKGKEWEFALEMSKRLRSGTYTPGAVRRVYIPKRDGRKRPLGIPNIEDRVIQRALVMLLEPIYEQVFLPCSYGFRPKRRATECVADAAKTIYTHRYVIEADIEGFFDNVSHKKLIGMLKEQIVDPRVLRLIRGILKSGFCEVKKPWQATKEGTPQGGPLSPILANVYLHYALDKRFEEVGAASSSRLYRYADDFIIASRSQLEIQALRRYLYIWMREAKLKLKESKTRIVDFSNHKRSHKTKLDFLGYKIHLRSFRDNPKRYWVARQPSEKSRKNLRQSLKERLKPNLSVPEARATAKLIWVGWMNYFRHGNSNRIFYKERDRIKLIWNWYLRCKYRHQRRPVPWRKLRPLSKSIRGVVRPMRVIPGPTPQQQMQLAFM